MKDAVCKWLATLVAAATVVVFVAMNAFAAESPSMPVTLIWPGVPTPTCTFNDEAQTVVLDDITSKAFSDASVRNVTTFTVGITCDSDVTSVLVVPRGTPDGEDDTLFSNTGSAKHVALRLMRNGNTMEPDGSIGSRVTPAEGGDESLTYSAGYVATAPGEVTPGSFASTATFSFLYD